MINNIFIDGKLVRDVEIKLTKDGKSICNFSICNNLWYQDKEHPQFFECVAFGRTADSMAKFLKKGSDVTILGVLNQNTWEGQDGTKHSKVIIKAEVVKFQFPPKSPESTTEENPWKT